jgi:NAD(P)-dependent dehydrogenase (short-subunit alcohol dehydrogenase family)
MQRKVVLITGAGGNLGKAVVDTFVKADYDVIATVSPMKKLGYTVAKFVDVHALDLTDQEQVYQLRDQLINTYKKIDALVLLAGGFTPGNILETNLLDVQKMISLNFATAFSITQSFLPNLISQATPSTILFVGSRQALHPEQGENAVAYTLSKSLLLQFSKILNNTSKDHLRSSVIIPTIIDTPANREAMPHANFSTWVSPERIATLMVKICNGEITPTPYVEIFGEE